MHRGRGCGSSTGRRIYCQLCGKRGHFVDKCYHRFDRNFQRTSNENFGKCGSMVQSDPQALITAPNKSNEVFLVEVGSVSGAHCGYLP